MSAFLYRRGKGVKRRVAHLPMYNRYGEIVGPLCQRRVNLDMSCNLLLVRRICKLCRKAQGAIP